MGEIEATSSNVCGTVIWTLGTRIADQIRERSLNDYSGQIREQSMKMISKCMADLQSTTIHGPNESALSGPRCSKRYKTIKILDTLNQIAVISQATCWKAFSCTKMFVFLFKFHWNIFRPLQIMAMNRRPNITYWPSSALQYCVTRQLYSGRSFMHMVPLAQIHPKHQNHTTNKTYWRREMYIWRTKDDSVSMVPGVLWSPWWLQMETFSALLVWRFVQGIHRSPVNSPHEGQWRGALMFSLICAWTNGWANHRDAGDLRRHRSHYDVTVMGGWVPETPGARFTNDFLPAIQIRWKLRLAVILLLAIRSQQIFAHATTAQLSCHVQNFVAITVLESRGEWNEISIEYELRWKHR